MRKYWDLDQEERGALTEEQMRAFDAFALMEAGIVSPKAPTLLPEKAPNLARETKYVINFMDGYRKTLSVAFDTPEQARAFLDLKPIFVDNIWLGHGSEPCYRHLGDATYEAQALPTQDTVLAVKSQIDVYKANSDTNRKNSEAYQTAVKKATETTKGMWEDWRECQALVEQVKDVGMTYQRYLAMCDGNVEHARKFLETTYSLNLVEKAIGTDVGVKAV